MLSNVLRPSDVKLLRLLRCPRRLAHCWRDCRWVDEWNRCPPLAGNPTRPTHPTRLSLTALRRSRSSLWSLALLWCFCKPSAGAASRGRLRAPSSAARAACSARSARCGRPGHAIQEFYPCIVAVLAQVEVAWLTPPGPSLSEPVATTVTRVVGHTAPENPQTQHLAASSLWTSQFHRCGRCAARQAPQSSFGLGGVNTLWCARVPRPSASGVPASAPPSASRACAARPSRATQTATGEPRRGARAWARGGGGAWACKKYPKKNKKAKNFTRGY